MLHRRITCLILSMLVLIVFLPLQISYAAPQNGPDASAPPAAANDTQGPGANDQSNKTLSPEQHPRVDFTVHNSNAPTVSPTEPLEAGKGGQGCRDRLFDTRHRVRLLDALSIQGRLHARMAAGDTDLRQHVLLPDEHGQGSAADHNHNDHGHLPTF